MAHSNMQEECGKYIVILEQLTAEMDGTESSKINIKFSEKQLNHSCRPT